MATTTQTFTGTGSQTQFSIAFSYRTTADVKATINAVATTAFSVSGSTVTFNSAPANGAAVVIFRETDNDTIEADFQSGSALRAVDLNDNFEQLLFVTQESTNTAATAETNSNTAVSTANTASTNASNAVTTANSAATDAATAISTANSATTTANSATATANAATTTANTASSNATAAVNTANTASSNATAAVNTANTASSNATAAVNTANTASSNASTAVSTANSATATANAASAAVANAVLYDPVANVAAIPGSPSDGDYVEVQDSTGIQSFSPLSGMPSGFIGDSGLVVRLKYVTSPSTTWQWQNYFAKDSETRYLKDNAAQIVDADVNASAAIAGTKISPDFGSQAITTTGASTFGGDLTIADKIIHSGDTNTAIRFPAADTVSAETSGNERLRIDSSGNLGIGTASPASLGSGFTEVMISGNTEGAGLQLQDTDGNVKAGIFTSDNSNTATLRTITNHPLTFRTNDSERLRIDSSGNLFIGGSTASAADIALNANGSATFAGTITSSNRINVNNTTTTASDIVYSINTGSSLSTTQRTKADGTIQLGSVNGGADTANIVLNANGSASFASNVGIGTTSPGVPLDISSNNSTANLRVTDNTNGARIKLVAASTEFDIYNTGGAGYIGTPTNSDILIATNNTERIRIDSSGRVGIGNSTMSSFTGNASDNLVVGGGSGSEGITVYSAAQGSLTFADGTSGNAAYRGAVEYSHTADQLAFRTAGTGNRMVINSSGLVGIGTASPDDILHLNGSTGYGLKLTDSSSHIAVYRTHSDGGILKTASNHALLFGTNDQERLRIGSNGNVSVGTTTTDQAKLHVENGSFSTIFKVSSAGAQTAYGIYQNSATGFGTTDGYFVGVGTDGTGYVWNYENLGLGFGTNNTERLRIDSSGNIGINRTDPNQRLNVSGNIETNAHDGTSGSGGYYTSKGLIIGNAYDAGKSAGDDRNAIIWQERGLDLVFATTDTERMRIDSSGRIGVGVTPPNYGSGRNSLDIHSSGSTITHLGITNSTTGSGGAANGFNIIQNGLDTQLFLRESGFMSFSTSSLERMRIDSSGRVGIGTTSPSESLEVAGNGLKVSGQSTGITDEGITFDWQSAGNNARIFSESAGSSNLLFYTTNSGARNERMRITSGGNLGIGTTNPLGDLTVSNGGAAGIELQPEITTNTNRITNYNRSTNAYVISRVDALEHHFYVSGNEKMRIDSSGTTSITSNVAVNGSELGSRSLQIQDSGTDNAMIYGDNSGYLSIQGGASQPGSGIVLAGKSASSDPGTIKLFTTTASNNIASAERMRIEADGDIRLGSSTDYAWIRPYESSTGNLIIASNQGSTGGGNDSAIVFRPRGTERMRIDSAGRVGIGTSNIGADLAIGNFDSGSEGIILQSSTSGTGYLYFADGSTGSNTYRGFLQYDHSNDHLLLGIASAERMRISNEGITYHISTNHGYHLGVTASAGTSKYIYRGHHSATAGTYNSGTTCYTVWSNGNVQNTNDSYGQISDVKLKENIVDAPSQWDDFKAVRFRKYNFKEETGYETHTQLGVIAQELELTSPGLVYETPDVDDKGNDLGTTTKAVKSSVLTKKALVALQEAMDRIETLEAKVAALEAA